MKISTTKNLLGLALAGCFGLAALPAASEASPVSDSFTVFGPTGGIFAQVIATEANEVANGANFIYVIPSPTSFPLANPTQFGFATQVIENAAVSPALSDIFGVVNGVAPGCDDPVGFCLAFASDTDEFPVPFSGAFILPEGNGIFDATMYLNIELQREGFTAEFHSDPKQATVPEPGSLALLVIGVAALGVLLRKAQPTPEPACWPARA